MTDGPGRRERKKAATRHAISEAAMELFAERGFDAVSVREVAEHADVSPTTVFAHFPQKEALVFDEDDERRDAMIAAVRERVSGTSVSTALLGFFKDGMDDEADYADQMQRFRTLISETTSLREYEQRMWLNHATELASAIADELGLAEATPEIRAYARCAVDIPLLASADPEPRAFLTRGFALLDGGWSAYVASL
ncbi:MAG: helix-turn-helix domain-containing protein [Microbacterium sp.]